jgi:hypothetical protein
MENIISIEKYIEMGKVKVVPVETETPSDVAEPDVKEPSEPEVKSEPDVIQESLAVEAPVVEESKPKKEPSMISCENCGKSMLMKTYKYSHMKVCKPSVPEPPPPPPPTPEPKAKAKPKPKAAPPKPKAAPPKPKAEKPVIAKPEFKGEVSFSNFEAPQLSHNDLYRQAREQRQQQRVQRVRSLISQAI